MNRTHRKIIPEYQGRTGLFTGCRGVAPIVMDDVRITVPAREALEAAGATFAPGEHGHCWDVTLGRTMPMDLVVCRIPGHYGPAVRREIEEEWPIEEPADYWVRAAWAGCPKCGAPLVWYEAGYVPGYRVCARKPHHHVLLR